MRSELQQIMTQIERASGGHEIVVVSQHGG